MPHPGSDRPHARRRILNSRPWWALVDIGGHSVVIWWTFGSHRVDIWWTFDGRFGGRKLDGAGGDGAFVAEEFLAGSGGFHDLKPFIEP